VQSCVATSECVGGKGTEKECWTVCVYEVWCSGCCDLGTVLGDERRACRVECKSTGNLGKRTKEHCYSLNRVIQLQ